MPYENAYDMDFAIAIVLSLCDNAFRTIPGFPALPGFASAVGLCLVHTARLSSLNQILFDHGHGSHILGGIDNKDWLHNSPINGSRLRNIISVAVAVGNQM